MLTDQPVFRMDSSHSLELIEGSADTVNMTASANHLPIRYEWAKESTSSLELEKLRTNQRLSLSDGVLNISEVSYMHTVG